MTTYARTRLALARAFRMLSFTIIKCCMGKFVKFIIVQKYETLLFTFCFLFFYLLYFFYFFFFYLFFFFFYFFLFIYLFPNILIYFNFIFCFQVRVQWGQTQRRNVQCSATRATNKKKKKKKRKKKTKKKKKKKKKKEKKKKKKKTFPLCRKFHFKILKQIKNRNVTPKLCHGVSQCGLGCLGAP